MKCRHRNRKRKFLFWRFSYNVDCFQLGVNDFPKWFLKLANKNKYVLYFYGKGKGELVREDDEVSGKSWYVADLYDYIINDKKTHTVRFLNPDAFKREYEIVDENSGKGNKHGFCSLFVSDRNGTLRKNVV